MGLQAHHLSSAILGDQSGEDFFGDGLPDDDRLFGNAGSDLIFGYRGRDLILGGPGDDDATHTFPPRDIDDDDTTVPALFGGEGRDTVIGGSGSDRMGGGAGRDTILADERDFGEPPEVDLVADCGRNLEHRFPDPGHEYFRRSPGDPITTCTRQIPDDYPVTWQLLAAWIPGSPWPWFDVLG